MQVFTVLLIIIFSIVGITDAGYLTYEKLSGIIPPCTNGFQCERVLTSPYAQIGPVPLSVFGLFYYMTIFVLACMVFTEVDFKKFPLTRSTIFKHTSPLELLTGLSIFGFLFSVYLVVLMAFIIKAWCLYCLISALTSTLISSTVLTYAANFSNSSPFYLKGLIFAKITFLYRFILKPIFFLQDPEFVHNSMVSSGQFFSQFAVVRVLLRTFFGYFDPRLERQFDGITFPNPVGLSAGFDYNGRLFNALPSVGFGWHTIGTVTLRAYEGNELPRLTRLPKSHSILVNKGLKNIGAKQIIENLKNVDFSIPTGISIASTNKHYKNTKLQIDDIIECFTLFEKSHLKHSYYELNISCPNTFGGEPFTTPERLEQLLTNLEKLRIKRPLYVKMPIDQSEKETLQLLKVVDAFTVAGVIFGNLTKDKTNPAVHKEELKTWQKQRGNLSGRPTYERSNRLLALTRKHFKNRFTIIGTGGIFSPEDAAEKIRLGADLVQLITGMIYNGPQLIGSINRKLSKI